MSSSSVKHHSLLEDFALRLAVAIDDLQSSHAYFIMQKAFGEQLDWADAQKKLTAIIVACRCSTCKKVEGIVRRTLRS